jgi:hypothetical protein
VACLGAVQELDQFGQPQLVVHKDMVVTFSGQVNKPDSLCPADSDCTMFNGSFTIPGPFIVFFSGGTCSISGSISSFDGELPPFCVVPPGEGDISVVGFELSNFFATATNSIISGFITGNNSYQATCDPVLYQPLCAGGLLQLAPDIPGDFCDITNATATLQLSGGGGGGGGFGGAIAPTHDVELSAFQIEPQSCPACNQVNGDFLFPGVYLNGIDTQSFAAPAGENAVCNNNDHLGWHWTVRPVDNPGLTAELRRYTVTESGAFESVLAIYEYNGGVADWLQGSPATLSLKTPLPPDPDNLCRYLSSWVTLTATPLQ